MDFSLNRKAFCILCVCVFEKKMSEFGFLLSLSPKIKWNMNTKLARWIKLHFNLQIYFSQILITPIYCVFARFRWRSGFFYCSAVKCVVLNEIALIDSHRCERTSTCFLSVHHKSIIQFWAKHYFSIRCSSSFSWAKIMLSLWNWCNLVFGIILTSSMLFGSPQSRQPEPIYGQRHKIRKWSKLNSSPFHWHRIGATNTHTHLLEIITSFSLS